MNRRGFLGSLAALIAPKPPAALAQWAVSAEVVAPAATFGAISGREDLADIIYEITPIETPFITSIAAYKQVTMPTQFSWRED